MLGKSREGMEPTAGGTVSRLARVLHAYICHGPLDWIEISAPLKCNAVLALIQAAQGISLVDWSLMNRSDAERHRASPMNSAAQQGKPRAGNFVSVRLVSREDYSKFVSINTARVAPALCKTRITLKA